LSYEAIMSDSIINQPLLWLVTLATLLLAGGGSVDGTYDLHTVDGSRLPVEVKPDTGAGSTEVTASVVHLTPNGNLSGFVAFQVIDVDTTTGRELWDGGWYEQAAMNLVFHFPDADPEPGLISRDQRILTLHAGNHVFTYLRRR
jgi:hypothetical protein